MRLQTGKDLRNARKDHGLTLVMMANLAGYSEGYLSFVENERKPLTAGVLAAYSRVLEMSKIPVRKYEKLTQREMILRLEKRINELEKRLNVRSG